MTISCNGARICVLRRLRGVVYVGSRNVKRNGELGERYAVVTAEQWLDMHRVPGDESCVARLESYMTRN